MNVGFLNQFDFMYDNLEAYKAKFGVEENTKIIGEVDPKEKTKVDLLYFDFVILIL